MNGRNKYAEQFDRNAGEPADFDSLFRFEKGELIAKKRIKMHGSSVLRVVLSKFQRNI